MQRAIIKNLQAGRSGIYTRWKDVLSLDRESSPLGNPEVLAHMIDLTLDELFEDLLAPDGEVPAGRSAAANCPCGRNPYLLYFAAGRQAMREALVLAQVAMPYLVPAERDSELSELEAACREIERRHVEPFCAVCQFRTRAIPQPISAAS